jgi:hypothetical protein
MVCRLRQIGDAASRRLLLAVSRISRRRPPAAGTSAPLGLLKSNQTGNVACDDCGFRRCAYGRLRDRISRWVPRVLLRIQLEVALKQEIGHNGGDMPMNDSYTTLA